MTTPTIDEQMLLFIFSVDPKTGEQTLVHKEISPKLLTYDELNAWFTSFKSQLSCGTYQFDAVTLAGIREAFPGDEARITSEFNAWKALKLGDVVKESLAGTVWNDHASFEPSCDASPPPTTAPPVPSSTTEPVPVTSPPPLVPLPTVTTTSQAQVPVAASHALAVTGASDLTTVFLIVALIVIALGGVLVSRSHKVLDRLH